MNKPGVYVARIPRRSVTNKMIIESICFSLPENRPDITRDWVRLQAESWCDFVKSQHPKDDVFLIERFT